MLKRLFGTIFVTGIIMLALMGSYLYLFSRAPFGNARQEVHVVRGTSLENIVNTLAERKVIASAPLFRLYLIFQGVANQVRAGDYDFPAQITPKEVVHQLLRGDFKTYRFTIPEGWALGQIALLLERRGLVEAEPFLALCRDPVFIETLGIGASSLEGFLFPSTYETYHPEGPKPMINLMLQEFKKHYTPEMAAKAKELGLNQLKVVTLASIIEKETGKPEERPLIASVFHNRLIRQMPLQSDPTVIYGIKDFDGNLTRRHLETYTPYNTYAIPGLPPGPIASPGKAALLAVLYPAETEYLYFVSRNDGSHVFSKTLGEHQRNVQKYQLGRK